jgi:hypothetical protein
MFGVLNKIIKLFEKKLPVRGEIISFLMIEMSGVSF